MINITFPDGSVKQFENGTTPLQIAESLSSQLARDILAASVNDQEWDITRPINEDATIRLYKWDEPEGKHAFW
ncbi:MAG: TGS domain-containing protein, partial [Duncaniella sp.]|nr:TGS domain-containing protein [Duncaniella sp.]